MIATANFEGYFTEVNPAFTRTIGFTSEELLSQPFMNFVHPDDVEPTLAAAAQQTEEGHDVLNFQNRYRTKDGSYRWLEWMSSPDPERRALIAVARDVTDRKQLEELEHMRRHAETGTTILSGSSSDALRLAEEMARSHHEWWNGTGYPVGLREDEIPLCARIVAVADVFDALTHKRPYKPAWPVDDAVAEIRRLRGVQFDPQVVDAFDELDPYVLAGFRARDESGEGGQARTQAA